MNTPYFLREDARASIEIFDAEEVPTAVIKRNDFPMQDMRMLFDEGLSALFPAISKRSVKPAGPVFSLHHRMPTKTTDLEVGLPIDAPFSGQIDAGEDFIIEPSVMPAGKVAAISHVGPYAGLPGAWGSFMQKLAADGHRIGVPFWEVYLTEPGPDVDPETLRTDLYVLLED